MLKQLLIIILITLLVLIVLDFIPIKFAEKDINDDEYVYSSEPKLSSCDEVNWVAYKYKKGKLLFEEPQLYIVSGNDPNAVLSQRDFEKVKLYLAQGNKINRFVLKGEESNSTIQSDSIQFKELSVNEWDIIYPINRLSIRRLYVPKNYLTIYDFNWLNFIKR